MNKVNKRLLAIILAAALVLGSVAAGIGLTYASSPVQERFKQENSYTRIVNVDSTQNQSAGGAKNVRSSDDTIATVTISGGTYTIKGVSPGVVAIAAATSIIANSHAWQVIDDALMSGYDLANNGEINKKSSDSAFNINNNVTAYTTPRTATVDGEVNNKNYVEVKTNVLAYKQAQIKWKSRNTEVADCELDGTVTPKAKGTTVLLGEFTDRWGKPRTITVLLGVDTIVGRSILSDLMDVINKAKAILGLDPNPYQEAGLGTLQAAVTAGETVLASTDPDEGSVNTAIDAIEDAIDGLKFKAGIGDGLINVGDQYFKPAGPENVYEIVDENGNSMQPEPKFIYDPNGGLKKDPPELDSDVVPAYKDGFVYYVEETPPGSNIFVPINADGTKDYDSAVWGGANGLPERTDSPAVKSGSTWYAEDPKGSNLWKPVLTSASAGSEQGKLVSNPADWVGGGEDGKPTGSDNLYPIVEKNGQIVAGEFGPDGDGEKYYIGMGGDGRFDTKGSGGVPVGHEADARDVKLYDQGDGTFGTVPPVKTVKATDITLSKTSIPDLAIGASETISVTGTTPADTTDSLSSAVSSNSAVATAVIENGKVKITGEGEGTATITVKFGDVIKTIAVTVVPDVTYPDIVSVTLTGKYISSGGEIDLIEQTKITYIDREDEYNPVERTVAYSPALHGPADYVITAPTSGLDGGTKIKNNLTPSAKLGIVSSDIGKPITVKVTIGGASTSATFNITPPGTNPQEGTGRTFTDISGTWLEIATNGGYSLIVRTVVTSTGKFNTYATSGSENYIGSLAQTTINNWYADIPEDALIKQYAVDNNAMDKISRFTNGVNAATSTGGISSPVPTKNQTTDVAFLLSLEEASRYCGKLYWNGYSYTDRSLTNDRAYLNWVALGDEGIVHSWLRTPYLTGNVCMISFINGTVSVTISDGVTNSFGFRPALWVVTNSITWTTN